MSDIIIKEYRGYTVKFNTKKKLFRGEMDTSEGGICIIKFNRGYDTYESVTDKIDRLIKEESKGKIPIGKEVLK